MVFVNNVMKITDGMRHTRHIWSIRNTYAPERRQQMSQMKIFSICVLLVGMTLAGLEMSHDPIMELGTPVASL